jgi:hypothetical protein
MDVTMSEFFSGRRPDVDNADIETEAQASQRVIRVDIDIEAPDFDDPDRARAFLGVEAHGHAFLERALVLKMLDWHALLSIVAPFAVSLVRCECHLERITRFFSR